MSHPKRSLSWVVLHLTVIGLAITSLLTGLRIAAVSRPEIVPFSALLPQGSLHDAHLLSAMGLIAVATAYLLLRLTRRWPPSGRRGFHQRVIQSGYLLLPLLMSTGTALYFGTVVGTVQDIHYYAALGLIFFLFLHAGLMFVQFGGGIFTRITFPARPTTGDAGIIAVTTVIALVLVALSQGATHQTLTLSRIELTDIIDIDGIMNEAVWSRARPVKVQTHGGANFVDGATAVTVRALHNGTEAFFYLTWADPTHSLRHLPLVKEEEGWRVLENGFYRFDETTHYEDKFAVMLAENCDPGGSDSTRLGPQPLTDKPPNWHGKGYHYTDDGGIRDVWHWKAVRTNDMHLADDNYFGAPDDERSGSRRYPAGYLHDGKSSGGYVMNWQWYSPDGVTPKRLPGDASELAPYQLGGSTGAPWVIPWYDYDLYDAAKDEYEPGTVMPAVLYSSNRFEGDRADVRARAVWEKGQWSLELARPLDTGSPQDIALKDGVCLWVAAFDRAQFAHTRHARPLRLSMRGAN